MYASERKKKKTSIFFSFVWKERRFKSTKSMWSSINEHNGFHRVSTKDAIRYRKPQFQLINRFYSTKCIDLWSTVLIEKNPFQIRSTAFYIFHLDWSIVERLTFNSPFFFQFKVSSYCVKSFVHKNMHRSPSNS